MSTELVSSRTQAEIEQSILIKTRNLQRILVSGACDIGLDLTELKAKVPHGEWGASLKRLGYSSSTANNFMRLYEAYGANQVSLFGGANSQTFGNLEYSKALALLAVPEEEREDFAAEVKAEQLSVRQLKEAIRQREAERDEARNQAEGWKLKAEQAKADANLRQEAAEKREQENSLLAQRVKELENRPVEVATVDASAEQIAEAEERGHTAAMKDAAKELKKAKKEWKEQTNGLEQQNRELTDALEAARKETARYQGDNADLLSQLETAQKAKDQAPDKAIVEMNLLFRSLQETGNKMVALLPQVDEVNRAKLKKALPQALRQMAERMEGAQDG